MFSKVICMVHNRLRSVACFLAVTAVTVLIIFFSLEQGAHVPKIRWVPFADKGLHACAYGLLGVLIGFWRGKGKKGLFLGFCFVFCLGLSMEMIQPYFGRSRELLDLVADLVGGSAGLFVGAACSGLWV